VRAQPKDFQVSCIDLGRARVSEAIHGGEDIGAVISGLSGLMTTQTKADVFRGAVSQLLSAYSEIRRAGYTLTSADPQVQSILSRSDVELRVDLSLAFAEGNGAEASRLLAPLCAVVSRLRDHVNLQKPQISAESDAPMAVRVTSFPKRITTTEIHRDIESMEIVRTVQTETDA
jgi:hypothetical protein